VVGTRGRVQGIIWSSPVWYLSSLHVLEYSYVGVWKEIFLDTLDSLSWESSLPYQSEMVYIPKAWWRERHVRYGSHTLRAHHFRMGRECSCLLVSLGDGFQKPLQIPTSTDAGVLSIEWHSKYFVSKQSFLDYF
jgi:hypothetical protein